MEVKLNNINMENVVEALDKITEIKGEFGDYYEYEYLSTFAYLLLNSTLKSIIKGYNKNEVAVKRFDVNADTFLQLIEGIYEFDSLYIKNLTFIPVLLRINPVVYVGLIFVKNEETDRYVYLNANYYLGISYKEFKDSVFNTLYDFLLKSFNDLYKGISNYVDHLITVRLVESALRGYKKVYNYCFFSKYFSEDVETIRDFSYLNRSLININPNALSGHNLSNLITVLEYFYPPIYLFIGGLVYDKMLLKHFRSNLSYLGLVRDSNPLIYHFLKFGKLPNTLPEWKYLAKWINTVDYKKLIKYTTLTTSLNGFDRDINNKFIDKYMKPLKGKTLTYGDIIDLFLNGFEEFNIHKSSPVLINQKIIKGKNRIKSSDRYEVTFKIAYYKGGTYNAFITYRRFYLLFNKIDPENINMTPESLKAASRYFRKITGMKARYYPVWENIFTYISDASFMDLEIPVRYTLLKIEPHEDAPVSEVEEVKNLYKKVGDYIQLLDREHSKLKPTLKSLLEYSKKVHDVDAKLQMLTLKVKRINMSKKIYKPIMPLIDSLKELEPYWIPTSEEIEYKGAIYKHCLWSYATIAEKNAVWFFDYEEAVAHVTYNKSTGKLVLVQCYSPGNKVTATSRKLAKMVNEVLARANLNKEKLKAEVIQGLEFLQQNESAKENSSYEQRLAELAVPA